MKFIAILVLLFAVTLNFCGDDSRGKKIIPKHKTGPVKGNNFSAGVPLESPVFMNNWGTESFEANQFPPPGWARFTAAENVIAWERMLVGQLPPGWPSGFGLEVSAPPGGGNAVALVTYDGIGTSTNDLWLVTPKIYNIQTTDSLIFWISKKADYIDTLDIRASRTRNDTAAAFSILVGRLTFGANNNDSAWVRKAYRLNAAGILNGDSLYFGFREHVANNLTDGAIIQIDLISGVGSSVLGTGNIPGLVAGSFSLSQNYPNPFNPNTTIYYSLPGSSNVKLAVYDVLGNEIALLVNENKLGGTYKAVFHSGNLASGVYFYRLTAGDYTEVRRMTLIK